MVGGRDYNKRPFNLATQGQRQPGSAFKPFTLAAALTHGHLPGLGLAVAQARVFDVPGARTRSSSSTTSRATTPGVADAGRRADLPPTTRVFAAVGLQVGTKRVARMAARGWASARRSRRNPAMTLGGLRQGVTPLDMAHAYETFAAGGRRVTGTLGAPERGPVGIRVVRLRGNGRVRRREPAPPHTRPGPGASAEPSTTQIMATVVQHRHGPARGLRRVRRRQDRHDGELRRRLVRRLHQALTRSPCGSAIPTSSSRCTPSSAASRSTGGTFPAAHLARLHGHRRRGPRPPRRRRARAPRAAPRRGHDHHAVSRPRASRPHRRARAQRGRRAAPAAAPPPAAPAPRQRRRRTARRRRPKRRRRRPPAAGDADAGARASLDPRRRRRRRPAPPSGRRRADARGGGGRAAPATRAARGPGGRQRLAQPGRPRPRDAAAAHRAEAPRQLDAPCVIPTRGPRRSARRRARRPRGSMRTGPSSEVGVVAVQARCPAPASACPGPSRGPPRARAPRRARIASTPSSGSSARIEHRGADALAARRRR